MIINSIYIVPSLNVTLKNVSTYAHEISKISALPTAMSYYLNTLEQFVCYFSFYNILFILIINLHSTAVCLQTILLTSNLTTHQTRMLTCALFPCTLLLKVYKISMKMHYHLLCLVALLRHLRICLKCI